MKTQTFGQQLREARKAKKLSVVQVTQKLGIAGNTIYTHERGDAMPCDEAIRAYAELYGMKYEEAKLVPRK